jgi:ATP-dependent DNA helicase 2 subunit 1
LELADE